MYIAYCMYIVFTINIYIYIYIYMYIYIYIWGWQNDSICPWGWVISSVESYYILKETTAPQNRFFFQICPVSLLYNLYDSGKLYILGFKTSQQCRQQKMFNSKFIVGRGNHKAEAMNTSLVEAILQVGIMPLLWIGYFIYPRGGKY